MKAHLDELRKLITLEIPRLMMLSDQDHNARSLVADWMLRFPLISEEIKESVYQLATGDTKKKEIAKQLGQLQRTCTALLDLLKAKTVSELTDKTDIEAGLYQCLNEVLDYLEHHHLSYFDFEAPVPAYTVERATGQFLLDRPRLASCLKKWAIDERLGTILFRALDPLEVHGLLNSSQIIYKQHLMKSILSLDLGYKNRDANGDLMKHLVLFGLNCPHFIAYYQRHISDELSELLHLEAKLEKLCSYEKLFTLQQQISGKQYIEHTAQGSEMMLAFINLELKYLQQAYYSRQPAQLLSPTAQTIYRVKTCFSADSLVYLIRLLIETSMIEANPRTNLMAFMATHFETAGSADGPLSANSLSVKYRQVTQKTALRIRSLLKEMIRHIDADFQL